MDWRCDRLFHRVDTMAHPARALVHQSNANTVPGYCVVATQPLHAGAIAAVTAIATHVGEILAASGGEISHTSLNCVLLESSKRSDE